MTKLAKQKAIDFLYLLVLICPVFIGFSLVDGVVFDATPLNTYSTPSLPIGIFVVFLSFLYYLRVLKMPIIFVITILVLLVYLVISITTPLFVRTIPLFLGMVVPIINYHMVTLKIKNGIDYFNLFKQVCFSIVWIKFICDIVLYNTITTEFIISDKVAIYNYFDYFPFFYCLTFLIIIQNAVQFNKISIFALLTAAICVAATIGGHSRVFQAIIIIQPLIITYLRFVPIKVLSLSYFITVLLWLMTLIIGLFFYANFESDPSLSLRFGHWHDFLVNTSIENIFIPIFNPYRLELDFGTTHNEFLEIYSLFGIGFIFFIISFTKIFNSVQKKWRPLGMTIMIILLLGTLIQLNITNPHLGILWSTILAILRVKYGNLNSKRSNMLL